MKTTCILAAFALSFTSAMFAAESSSSSDAAKNSTEPLLASTVFDWTKLQPTPIPNGERRAVLDSRTATLDKLHCHITTLKPGEVSGEPRLHLQEEIIIIKEGTIEAMFDGNTRTAGPGSIVFFASNATTRLRNIGDGPATYYVVYYYTPLTPKG